MRVTGKINYLIYKTLILGKLNDSSLFSGICLITFINTELHITIINSLLNQALQEELAEELKAKELEKHLAMMELGGAEDNVQFVTEEEVNCPKPASTVSPAQEEVPPAGQSGTSKPVLPYSSLFCFGSDNRSDSWN